MRLLKPHELVKAIADLQSRVAVLEAAKAKPAVDEALGVRVKAIEEALAASAEAEKPKGDEKPKGKAAKT